MHLVLPRAEIHYICASARARVKARSETDRY